MATAARTIIETAHMVLRFPYAAANVLCVCVLRPKVSVFTHNNYTLPSKVSDLNDVMCVPKQKLYAIIN